MRRFAVALSLIHDFEGFTTFKPTQHQERTVNAMLDDLIAWAPALRDLRAHRKQ